MRKDLARSTVDRGRKRPGRISGLAGTILALSTTFGAAESTDIAFEDRVRAFILSNPEVIIEALELLSQREERAAQTARIAKYPDLFTEPHVLGLGPKGAATTIVEFFDYRCAPCKALHPKLKAALADHPELRVEMRHLPILSPGSERGARFALAVKAIGTDAQYEAAHAALWALRGPLGVQAFERIAADQGLDWMAVRAAMASDAVSARIEANRDIAIDLQILGTPAFVTPTSVSFGATDVEALVADWLSR